MAHLKKNTRGAVPGLAVHFERKTDHHTNKEIDVSKAYLNNRCYVNSLWYRYHQKALLK